MSVILNGAMFVLGAIAFLLLLQSLRFLIIVIYRLFFETKNQRLARLFKEYGEGLGRDGDQP